jgi:plastocyanin
MMDLGDRDRLGTLALVLGAIVTLAASAFAVGAAISSDDDSSSAGGTDTVPAASAPAAGEPSATAAVGTSPPVTATGRFDIEIAQYRFAEENAVVPVGTEVVWTNSDADGHSIVSDDGAFPSSDVFGQGETYSHVFTAPGTYTYHCGVHPNMTATITVEA